MDTGRFKSYVSDTRRQIGTNVFTGLLLAAVTSFASSYLTASKAQADMGTSIAVLQSQITVQNVDLKAQIGRLQADFDQMRRDLYAPRSGRQ